MNLDEAGRILYYFQCRISWFLWFCRLCSAHSGSRTPFTIWNAPNVISHRKFVSWSIRIIRYEVPTLKSSYVMLLNCNFIKRYKLKNLLGHVESEPMLGLKLLVGPRWREFHCLAASRCSVSWFSFFVPFAWCEALFLREAFKEFEGVGGKMGARPFLVKISGV